jgi:predicted negative regulator of RcsB-dependent stress response
MTFLELERRCKKRRVFKFIRYLFFVILLVVAGVTVYYYVNNNLSSKNIHQSKPVKIIKKQTKIKEENKTKPVEKIKKPPQKPKANIPKITYELDLNVTEIKEEKVLKKTKEKNESKAKIIKPRLNLQSTSLPSYETCISLAEKYLKEGNYADALQWAKNANLQNKSDAMSWIISAKALYLMNKKNQALKLLKIYYNYHKDERVKKLIGEFSHEK